MSIFPLMVLLALLVAAGAVLAFFWAVDHDQFEDLEYPAYLPMLDDGAPAGAKAERSRRGESLRRDG
jgi:cbb3-type cytochrome oxidase maturation protein